MSSWAADLRHALRSLREAPAFSLTALLTLAVGVGLNAAVFSAVHGVLLRPFDLPQPDRLVAVWQNMEPRGGSRRDYTSRALFVGWRARNRCFSGMGLFGAGGLDLTGIDPPEHVEGAMVSHDFLPVLGVQPMLGRSFRAEDETEDRRFVVILSSGLWARRFGRDPGLVGKTITASGHRLTVIGVLPPSFRPPVRRDAEVWFPIPFDPPPQDLGIAYLGAIGRLKPGISPAAAQADMDRVESTLVADHPAELRGIAVLVEPLLDSVVGSTRKPLLLLFAAGSLVLLVACFNVANLSLARASARRTELATRLALGAGRGRLARLFVAESLLLAASGAVLGLFLGFACLAVLRGLAPPQMPRLDSVRLDSAVAAATFTLSLAIGLAAGLMAAAWSQGRRPFEALRQAGGGTSGRAGLRARGTLVVAQIAACVLLLVGAGALVRSLLALTRVDPGFPTARVLLAHLSVPPSRRDASDVADFAARLEERLGPRPEIAAAGIVSPQPLDGVSPYGFSLDGQEPAAEKHQNATWRWVSPAYLRGFGPRLLAGRLLAPSDTATAPLVALVNESFVRRFLGGRQPLGRRCRSEEADGPKAPWRLVVGVVSDIRGASLDQPPQPEVYLPLTQDTPIQFTVVVRAARSPGAALAALRAAVKELRPGQVVARPQMLEEVIGRGLAPRRFTATLIGTFALVALLLAAVGIYGVTVLAVTLRQRELAVRQALGAAPSSIAALVLRWSALLVASGLAAGLAGWLAAGKVVSSLLYEVKPLDGPSIAAAVAFLALVALATTLAPALRAARGDIARILKSDT